MKCLSLWQPWATLIALGAKCVETRSWSTTYRGPIAIHTATKWTRELSELCYDSPFYEALSADPEIKQRLYMSDAEVRSRRMSRPLPLGCIVATATLTHVLPTPRHPIDPNTTVTLFDPRRLPDADPGTFRITPQERAFGDYSPHRYAWVLADVRRLPSPVWCCGRQGLFDVPDPWERSGRR